VDSPVGQRLQLLCRRGGRLEEIGEGVWNVSFGPSNAVGCLNDRGASQMPTGDSHDTGNGDPGL
jgi:hypothetical protein